jgi:hypothetical protein
MVRIAHLRFLPVNFPSRFPDSWFGISSFRTGRKRSTEPSGRLPSRRKPKSHREAHPVQFPQRRGLCSGCGRHGMGCLCRLKRPSPGEGRRIGNSRREPCIQNPKLPCRRTPIDFKQSLLRLMLAAARHRRLGPNLCPTQRPKLFLAFTQRIGIGQKVKAPWVPANRILGSQSKRRSHLAFTDGVIRRRGHQQCVRISSRLFPVHHQVPAAVPLFPRLNRHHPEHPPLAEGCLPLLPGIYLAGQQYLAAARRMPCRSRALDRRDRRDAKHCTKPNPPSAMHPFHRGSPSFQLSGRYHFVRNNPIKKIRKLALFSSLYENAMKAQLSFMYPVFLFR